MACSKDAIFFDGDISSWDVSNVRFMSGMFSNATSFNQGIGSWDVSSAQYMYDMFEDATSFSQNLGGWYVSPDSASIPGRGRPRRGGQDICAEWLPEQPEPDLPAWYGRRLWPL